jgi:hypothetical protein
MYWLGSVIRAGYSENITKDGLIEGNFLLYAGTGSYGMQLYASTQSTTTKRFNLISGFSQGVRMVDSVTGATGNTEVTNTSIVSCTTAVSATDTRLGFILNHLATKGSTTGISTTADAMTRMTRSYNTIDPTVSAFYTPLGTGDITTADADLDSRYFPTASGNCEANGNASALDWVGGTDWEGYPLRLASSVQDRGARCRPRIISGAELLPDIW